MMRRHLVSVAAAAILAGAATPSFAADMPGGVPGGLKGAMGVPVPAPVPYNDTYKYYVGGMVGWTFSSSGTSSMTAPGTTVDPTLMTGPIGSTLTATGLPGMRSFGDIDGPGVFSVFAGRYITPSIRAEVGLDIRSEQSVGRGAQSSLLAFSSPAVAPATGNDFNIYSVDRADEVKVRTNTLMLNAYYDFNRGGRITPYIGAGVGLSILRATRASTETSLCQYGINDSTPAVELACFGAPMPTPTVLTTSRAETQFGLAASLMAGASVAVGDRIHWDIGYRFMWQGSTVSLGVPGLGGTNTIKVGDRTDHEIRTGLRFDIH